MLDILKTLPTGPEHPRTYDCESHIKSTVGNILSVIELRKDEGSLHGVFGVMAGGKSETIRRLSEKLTQRGISAQVLKLAVDKRAGNQVYCRSGSFDAQPVNNVHNIIDALAQSEVTLVDEGPFLVPQDQLPLLTEAARAMRSHLVFTGLGTWFTGNPVETAAAFAEVSPDTFHILQARDSFDPHSSADYTLRFVGINLENGEIIHQDAVHGPYVQLNNYERIVYANDYLQKLPHEYSELLRKELIDGNCFPEGIVLLPSHPNDPVYALGADRYLPASTQSASLLYKSANMAPLETPGIMQVYGR